MKGCTRSRESKWYFLWNFFLSLRTSNLEFLPLDNLCIKESWLVCLLKLWQLFQLGHQFFSRVDSLHWVSTIVTRKLYLCWKTHIALLLSNPWKISCMFHQMNQKADLKSTSIMRNKSVKHKKTNHCDFRKSEPTKGENTCQGLNGHLHKLILFTLQSLETNFQISLKLHKVRGSDVSSMLIGQSLCSTNHRTGQNCCFSVL